MSTGNARKTANFPLRIAVSWASVTLQTSSSYLGLNIGHSLHILHWVSYSNINENKLYLTKQIKLSTKTKIHCTPCNLMNWLNLAYALLSLAQFLHCNMFLLNIENEPHHGKTFKMTYQMTTLAVYFVNFSLSGSPAELCFCFSRMQKSGFLMMWLIHKLPCAISLTNK